MNDNKHIVDYLRSNKKGCGANRMEREAMQDPFLSEALEGYGKHEGNHANDIIRLQQAVALSAQRRRNTLWWAAACVVALLGIGTFFIVRSPDEQLFPAPTIAESIDSTMKIVDTTQVVTLLAVTDGRKSDNPPTPPKARAAAAKEISPAPIVVAEMVADAEVEAMAVSEFTVETVADELAKPIVVAEAATAEMAKKSKQSEATAAMYEDAAKLDEVVVGYSTRGRKSSAAGAPRATRKYSPAKPEIGDRAYLKYIKDSLRYPVDTICADNLSGRVVLRFYVDASGRPYNIEVAQSLCESYDEEAIRLIKEGSKWRRSEEQVEYSIEFKKK